MAAAENILTIREINQSPLRNERYFGSHVGLQSTRLHGCFIYVVRREFLDKLAKFLWQTDQRETAGRAKCSASNTYAVIFNIISWQESTEK